MCQPPPPPLLTLNQTQLARFKFKLSTSDMDVACCRYRQLGGSRLGPSQPASQVNHHQRWRRQFIKLERSSLTAHTAESFHVFKSDNRAIRLRSPLRNNGAADIENKKAKKKEKKKELIINHDYPQSESNLSSAPLASVGRGFSRPQVRPGASSVGRRFSRKQTCVHVSSQRSHVIFGATQQQQQLIQQTLAMSPYDKRRAVDG